jgi:uncharacterized FlaG/YvyC family protein
MGSSSSISAATAQYTNDSVATSQVSQTPGLASAVNAINQSGLWPGTTLKVHLDTTSRSLTVQIINSESGEVMEQIPSEVALQLAADLGSPGSTETSDQNSSGTTA